MYCHMMTGINTNANTAGCCQKDCILLEGSLHLFTEQYAVYGSNSNHDRSCVAGKRESAYHSAAGTEPAHVMWAGTAAAYHSAAGTELAHVMWAGIIAAHFMWHAV